MAVGLSYYYFSLLKGDQEGVNRNGPWHIYSIPLCPNITHVIALAKHFLTYPYYLKGDFRFSPGDLQYNQFMKN